MIDGTREITVDCPEQGKVLLLFPIPRPNNPWGVFLPLKDTIWGEHIQIVTGAAMSHAMHGWATPLVRELGIPPLVRAKRIPELDGRCALMKTCISAGVECRPGVKLPLCYEPPKLVPDVARLAYAVAIAWRNGRHVIIIQGEEFVLR